MGSASSPTMILAADIVDFVTAHQSHGRLEAETGDLTPNGYRLVVPCPCGVTFHRWITPEEAAEDLAVMGRRN